MLLSAPNDLGLLGGWQAGWPVLYQCQSCSNGIISKGSCSSVESPLAGNSADSCWLEAVTEVQGRSNFIFFTEGRGGKHMAEKHCTTGDSSFKRERRGKDKIQPTSLNAAFVDMVSKQLPALSWWLHIRGPQSTAPHRCLHRAILLPATATAQHPAPTDTSHRCLKQLCLCYWANPTNCSLLSCGGSDLSYRSAAKDIAGNCMT